MTYTEKELNQFLHGISLSLLSKKSAQHWRYDEETAKEIEWLEALERKVRADKADRKTENCSVFPNNCERCKWWNESYGCHWKEDVCHYVPKAIIPKQCVSCDSASKIIEAYSRGFEDGAEAVKAINVKALHKDYVEPYVTIEDETTERQRLEGKRWTDALTIEEKKQLLDGWIVDEPQTERSE